MGILSILGVVQLSSAELAFYLPDFAVNPWSLPIFVCTLAFVALAIYVAYEFERTSVRFYFMAFCLLASVWVAFSALMVLSQNQTSALLWSRMAFAFSVASVVSAYLFSLKSVGQFSRRRLLFYAVLLAGAIDTFLILFTNTIIQGTFQYSWGHYPQFASTFYAHMVFVSFAFGLMFAEFLLDLTRDDISERRRNRDWGLLLAVLTGSLASVDFIPGFGYDIYPVGFLVILMAAAIIAFTIWKYRLVDYNPAVAAPEVFKAMQDSLIVSDTGGRIRLVNETFARKTGMDQQTLIGAPLTDVFPELTEVPSTTTGVDRLEEEETFLLDSDDEEIDVILSTSPMTDSHNNLSGVVFVARDITERKERQQKLEELEYYNSMTGLPNKKYVFNRLVPQLENPGESQVFYLEIDNFGELEAALGEVEISNLLRTIVERLRNHGLDDWELAHWHQSSFLLLNLSRTDSLETVGEELIELFDRPLELEERTLVITVSIGASEYPEHADSLDETIRKSSVALIDAKDISGNSLQVFEKGGRRSTSDKVDLIADLRSALDNDKLEMYYQPIIETQGERIQSLEALLRWDHPSRGYVAPHKVISLSEESGIIRDIGDWIFDETLDRIKSLNNTVDDPVKISFNFSNQQFEHSGEFLRNLDSRLNQLELDASNLRIEITETTAIQDLEFSKETLNKFKEHNVEVAIDDFGTGHSSMKYLMELPLDILKIDKSFILNLFENEDNQTLVEAMVTMGHELGLEVVAEGVETEEHRNYLRDLGCDYMQGYLWTPPRPYSDLVRYIENYETSNGSG